MPVTARHQIAFAVFVLAIAVTSGADMKKEAPAAPVPKGILSGRTVFLSNGGGVCEEFGSFDEDAAFSGGPNRAYNQLYDDLGKWGHYQLTGSPGEADLDFEIRFTCPAVMVSVKGGSSSGADHDPEIRLVIRDVKTGIVLWTIYEPVFYAHLQSNRDKNFDASMARLVNDLKALADGAPPPRHTNSGP